MILDVMRDILQEPTQISSLHGGNSNLAAVLAHELEGRCGLSSPARDSRKPERRPTCSVPLVSSRRRDAVPGDHRS
jgi:hypothetical protein